MGVLNCFAFCLCLLISFEKMTAVAAIEDASDVTWAHAVNSRKFLLKELAGPVDFLEADISLGHVIGNEQVPPIPVMAHPPNATSDISLEEWIDVLINYNTSKGAKLDFKSLEVVEPSLRILQAHGSQINFTLWLNADILSGPVNSTAIPVKYDSFLTLCKQYFPDAVISVGWTTRWIPHSPQFTWHYEWQHVRKMVDVLHCFAYKPTTPTFTFPVRGVFASRSIKKLRWLLGTIPGSSLTVWSAKGDPLKIEDLLKIRRSFPKDKVYYDIPDHRLRQSFSKSKLTESYEPSNGITIKDDEWVVLNRGTDHSCALNTYANNNIVVFGSSLKTAVLLKKVMFGDQLQSLKVYGKVKFFNSYDQPPTGKHTLTIAITDISLFSKNSSSNGIDGIDVSGSDTEVLWDALNASHLYAFEHDFSEKPTSCWIFKLDSTSNNSFQVWTVSCKDMTEEKSVDELISHGKPKISSRRRMVLPKGPFMFGFVSAGDNNVVLYDFEIQGENQHLTSASSVMTFSIQTIVFVAFSIIIGYVIKRSLI